MTDPAPRDQWERLLDLTVYAPIGAAMALREDLPKFVRQGRQAVENRVVLARFIGQMAVQQGQKELAKRVEARRQAAQHTPVAADTAITVERPAATSDDAASAPATRAAGTSSPAATASPDADQLPIAEYESLAASQVVQRLGSLRDDELAAIEAFETANRGRRTILGKIAQLRAG